MDRRLCLCKRESSFSHLRLQLPPPGQGIDLSGWLQNNNAGSPPSRISNQSAPLLAMQVHSSPGWRQMHCASARQHSLWCRKGDFLAIALCCQSGEVPMVHLAGTQREGSLAAALPLQLREECISLAKGGRSDPEERAECSQGERSVRRSSPSG